MPNFKVKSSRELLRVKPFSIEEEVYEHPSGKLSTHVTLLHPGAVVVLPELREGVYLFLRQYRHSLKKFHLELTAGTLGIGEDPLECATRELQEEAGYKARKLTNLGRIYPAPGFCNEVQHLFFASELSPSTLPQDDDEVIEVVEMSSKEILEAIDSGDLCDAKSLSCLLLAERKGLLDLRRSF